LVAPTEISVEGYSATTAYTVTINGIDFNDLFTTAPNVETVVGSVYLSSDNTRCSSVTAPRDGTTPRDLTYVSNTALTFDVQPGGNAEWLSTAILLDISAIPLCFHFAADVASGLPEGDNIFTGLHFGAVFACNTDAACGRALDVTGYPLVEIERRLIQGLTTCSAGQCINPNVQATCGLAGTAFEIADQRCCDGTRGTVSWLDEACPCRRQTNGSAPICPGDEPVCCMASKFQELIPTGCSGPNPDANCFTEVGQCYNPINHQCCDTGARFDPGTQQCCSITGLASRETPCPCETDLDCEGGATQDQGTRTPALNQRCCLHGPRAWARGRPGVQRIPELPHRPDLRPWQPLPWNLLRRPLPDLLQWSHVRP
jgi:hypothetical protein